ncbi:MAG: endonuclease/exonuclease/phosphatase family metal-dependent hydrolase [Planctomycetota bacterium]|jgi:endonuclease/exonuclease/phosphatase family metal-dependent hydrolase
MRNGRGFELGLLLLAALLLALGADWATPGDSLDLSDREPSSLRAVTWNVGQELRQGAAGLRGDQVEHVVERLKQLDADVILLQELSDREQGRQIQAGLGSEWISEISGSSGGRRLAILVRNADIEVKARRLRSESGTAMLALVDMYRRNGETIPLVISCVHAGAFSPEDRNELLGVTRSLMDRHAETRLRLLGGDLNIDLDPDARRDLFSDDARLDVQTYNFLLQAGSGLPGLVDVTSETGPTAEPDRRLDYFFASPELAEGAKAAVWRGQRAGGMDHDPVFVELRY